MDYSSRPQIPFTIITTVTTGGGVSESKSFVARGINPRDAAINFVAGTRFMPSLLKHQPKLARSLAARSIITKFGTRWQVNQFDGATFHSVDGWRRYDVDIIAEGVEDGAEEIGIEEILG